MLCPAIVTVPDRAPVLVFERYVAVTEAAVVPLAADTLIQMESQHVEVAPQPSGAAAIVGDRDHCRDVHQRTAAWPAVVFQPLQQGGKTRASADGDDTQRFGARRRTGLLACLSRLSAGS